MIPASANPLLLRSAATQYQVSRSLRFNGSVDNSYLSRTPASAGNRTTWTFSCWLKRSKLGAQQSIFIAGETYAGGSGDTWATGAMFGTDDKLYIYWRSSNSPLATTAAVYRDCSAWYHIVLTANSTTLKAYVNGSEVASGSISGNGAVNSTLIHLIGVAGTNTYFAYADQMLAECHFIDGQALTPSSFTEVSATTGQLVPKAYTGTYGTNGFKLTFSDNSATTATTLGKDYSGNSNNWTPNNLSVTTGAGNDSLVDTPTSYGTDDGLGGSVRGNYATGNPLFSVGASFRTLANGNLDWSYTNGSNTAIIPATVFPASGKWYAEFAFTSFASGGRIGIVNTNCTDGYVGQTTNGVGYENTGQIRYNGGVTSYGASWTSNDLIGVALDLDNGTVSFYKNGVSQGVARSGLTGSWTFGVDAFSGTCIANFGARSFAYTAPSGFKALCDTNLPSPQIAKPSTVMDVKLYTGNGGTQSITGLGFNPDLVWLKARSAAYGNVLHDAVRGAGYELVSNLTVAESFGAQYLQSFNSDGFTVGNNNAYNQSSVTYAAWAWDAGTTTTTINANAYSAGVPSITSSVRANTSAGFSIVSYTGNGTAGATIGHGLGAAPSLIITKPRSAANGWAVFHVSLGATKGLELNITDAAATTSLYWNNTAPTSTVFSVSTGTTVNSNSTTYIAYCWAPVAGYSSFGGYTGNGSSDGPFVYTGFRPRWVMFKASGAATFGSWRIFDAARNTYNVMASQLFPNLSNAEDSSTNSIDFLSNGFKIREGSYINQSSIDFIYCAFAESPFAYARAR